MFNLAPYRFRNILTEDGGPVERVEVGETSFFGRRTFMANAFLREDLRPGQQKYMVFGSASGTGEDASPMVARFKALSEAMERWAYLLEHKSGRYGFATDPSSNGMAAFPGLWSRQAREAALLEAGERYNLIAWWEGRLEAMETRTEWPGVRAAVLCSAAPGITVILHRQSSYGHYIYGHAAAIDFASACRHAAMEMERHDQVVQRYRSTVLAGVSGFPPPPEEMPTQDKRALYFASTEGYSMFLERLRTPPRKTLPPPRLAFDGAIPGPWGRYADVWRVAYEPLCSDFLNDDSHYFFW